MVSRVKVWKACHEEAGSLEELVVGSWGELVANSGGEAGMDA